MTRRSAIKAAAITAAASGVSAAAPAAKGRLKQSVARWCYKDMSIDDLCKNCSEMGLVAVDLVDEKDWPSLKKYGLMSSMVYSGATIPDGWNRKENHDRLVSEMEKFLKTASDNKFPN